MSFLTTTINFCIILIINIITEFVMLLLLLCKQNCIICKVDLAVLSIHPCDFYVYKSQNKMHAWVACQHVWRCSFDKTAAFGLSRLDIIVLLNL